MLRFDCKTRDSILFIVYFIPEAFLKLQIISNFRNRLPHSCFDIESNLWNPTFTRLWFLLFKKTFSTILVPLYLRTVGVIDITRNSWAVYSSLLVNRLPMDTMSAVQNYNNRYMSLSNLADNHYKYEDFEGDRLIAVLSRLLRHVLDAMK